jgi:transcriptional regulator with XRE-family HTH domain
LASGVAFAFKLIYLYSVPNPKTREPVITDGLRLLEQWLSQSGQPRSKLAAEVGVSGASLSAWLAGYSRPKQPLRKRICHVTGIEPDAWETEDERAFGRGEPRLGAA